MERNCLQFESRLACGTIEINFGQSTDADMIRSSLSLFLHLLGRSDEPKCIIWHNYEDKGVCQDVLRLRR